MKKPIYHQFLLSFIALSLSNCTQQQTITLNLSMDVVRPKTYVVHKINEPLKIDGKADEISWQQAQFTDAFTDIEGVKIPEQETKVKLLWDEQYLYVFALLKEKNIWGTIKKRDAVIFLNNDFEVFINPSNTTQNYGELEINALATVWDLFLDKPYYLGGKPKNNWDLKNLKSTVFIKGTLNNPTDTDDYWSVELAIPLAPYTDLIQQRRKLPSDGEQWRINFSRVEWDLDVKNNEYSRKKRAGKLAPEHNWVWSNQGAINMHLPENWGYLQFSISGPTAKVDFTPKTDIDAEQLLYALFRKIAFKKLSQTKNATPGTCLTFKIKSNSHDSLTVSYLKTFSGFTLHATNFKAQTAYTIREDGYFIRTALKKTNP